MKKYLIVLAAAIVALASCKPGEQSGSGSGSKYTKISFKETAIELAVGETAKLKVLYEPTTLEAPVCEWASSDTTVVTVDQNGNIEAVGYGESNVTATHGEGESALKAVCHVTVLPYEATWAPNSTVYYFPSTKSAAPVSDTTIVYKSESTGTSYTCKLYSVEMCIPTDIMIPGDEEGAGDYLFVTASIPFIESSTSGQYIGEPYDLAFGIAEDFNNVDFGAEAGSLDPAIIGPVWQAYFESIDAQQQPSFDKDLYATGAKGAHLRAAIIQDGSISSYPWYDAIVTGGYYQTLYDSETEELIPDYQLKVDWCAGALGTGLALNEEAQSYSEALAKPYALDLESYIYVAGEHGKPYEAAASPRKVQAKRDTKGMINFGKVEKLELVKFKEGK